MRDKKLVITDGHHRYESAVAYRDERRKNGKWTQDSAFNFHMCYMVPVQDEGLVVLPTHRLLTESKLTKDSLKTLEHFFSVTEIAPTVEALESFLKSNVEEHAFCIYNGSKAYGLLLRNEKDVFDLLNAGCPKELRMDEHILYAESTRDALEKVDAGQSKLAFLVNPIIPEMVWRIAQKNWRLPEKSTDFYPKPVSGLMMMDISPEEKL